MAKTVTLDVNLLFTNKGGNLRAVDNERSVTMDTLIIEQVKDDLNYLGSEALDKKAPWWYRITQEEFGDRLILSPTVSQHGDGSLKEQLKYAKKARITIELFD